MPASETNWNSYLGQIVQSIVDPITLEIMLEPVIAADGFTYDKDSINAWFDRKANVCQPLTSPSTGRILHSREVRPNFAIKTIVESTVKVLESELACGALGDRARDLLVSYCARLIEKEANGKKLLRLPSLPLKGKLRRCYGFILPNTIRKPGQLPADAPESEAELDVIPTRSLTPLPSVSDVAVLAEDRNVSGGMPLRRLPSLYTGVYHGLCHSESGSSNISRA